MKQIFLNLIKNYSSDQELTSVLWNEIEVHYSQPSRHYHSLNHLRDLYAQLTPIKEKIQNWNTMMFSLFYHDIIYKASKSNNEEKSAELAVARMTQLAIPKEYVTLCENQIIATKSHAIHEESDTNYFTDADLSILGRDWKTYQTYCENIRKEYSIYPNFMYRKGRKKVIKHFLDMKRIYKTEVFFQQYEEHARKNLYKELNSI